MNELMQLRALAAKLRTSGRVKLTTDAGPIPGLAVHRLIYETDGDVPSHYPITGAARFGFEFDEAVSTWNIYGSMFGVEPKATDPKTFFSAIHQGTSTRELTLRGFLQNTAQVAERYRGDLAQMCYKLGVQMAAVGTMVMGLESWTWTPSSDPGVVVYFFPDNVEPEPFTLRKAYFGFHPNPKVEHWELNQSTLMSMRKTLQTHATQARLYCNSLTTCFS